MKSESIPNAFGDAMRDVLRATRLEKNMTQRDLAWKSGYDITFISYVERGKRMPSLTSFVNLCRALGVLPWEALRRIESETTRSTSKSRSKKRDRNEQRR